jgi:hypothetical protein
MKLSNILIIGTNKLPLMLSLIKSYRDERSGYIGDSTGYTFIFVETSLLILIKTHSWILGLVCSSSGF